MLIFHIINGPNLNLQGLREIHLYKIDKLLCLRFKVSQNILKFCKIIYFQSNNEYQLINYIHDISYLSDGIVINPGALTHSSILLQDTLKSINIPCIEVHLSHICSRERYRSCSTISNISLGQISGFGIFGYELALASLIEYKTKIN